jgi:hypothetical protein
MNMIFFTFADGHVESFLAFGDIPKLQGIAKDWWIKNGQVAEAVHGEPVLITWRPASGSERLALTAALDS